MEFVAAVRRETGDLLGQGRGRLLLTIAIGWGLLIGTRMIYPVLLPALRSSFGLTLSSAGLLVTVLWLGSAFGQLPSGMLADRYSERSVMTLSPLIVAVGLVLVVTAQSAIQLFLVTAVVGIGLSLYPIARITILSDIYPDRIGSALGVTMATGDLGQTVLPPIGALLAAVAAWQLGLGFMIPLLVLISAGIWLTLPKRVDSDRTGADPVVARSSSLIGVLGQPAMVFVTIVLFLFIFIWQSFSAFYPTYLIEIKGISPPVAAALFGLYFAFGVVIKPLAGAAYDRIGMRQSLLITLVGPVAGLVMLPMIDRIWMLIATTALISTMLGTGAITQSYLSDAIPAEMRGTGLGAIRTVASTLGATGPVAFGVIADRGFFDGGYLVLAGILVVVILLTIRMPRG